MNHDFTIRKATRSDRDEVRAMWRGLALHQADVDARLSLAPDYLDRWEADFEPWITSSTHRLLLAVDAVTNSPLGFVHARLYEHAPVFESAPEVFVEAIWVHESARGRGCGRGLVASVLDWAYRMGAERIRYSVLVKDEVATDFWSSVGGDDLITYGTVSVERESGMATQRGEAEADEAPVRQLGFAQ